MKSNTNRGCIYIAVPILAIILYLLDFFDFNIWSQIDYIGTKSWDSVYVFEVPHHLRYALVKLLVLDPANDLQISKILAFEFSCYAMLIGAILVSFESFWIISSHFKRRRMPLLGEILLVALFLLTAYFMNGRLLFNFFGQAIISLANVSMLLHSKPRIGALLPIAAIPMALFLCSVSSGTFIVAIGTIIVATVLILASSRIPLWIKVLFLIVSLCTIGATNELISMYLLKNLNYYGGGFEAFISMMNHGFGKIIMSDFGPLALVTLLAGIFIAPTILIFLSDRPILIAPIAAIVSSTALGIYGWSTLFSMLPIVFVMLSTGIAILAQELRSKKPLNATSIKDTSYNPNATTRGSI